MPTRFPKTTSDIKVWGLTLNDSLRLLQLTNKINITANSNNPPTVKAGTMFTFYRTDTYLTPLSPATRNNVYPVNTSITYPINDVIFETTDRTFTWNNGGFPAIANSTIYYLHCSGGEDTNATSQGKGVYGASTVAPTYDTTKQGWYNASGKVLCRFYVDGSGNVLPGSICHYTDDLVAELYTTSTSAPSISGLDIIRDGGKYNIDAFLYFNHPSGGVSLYLQTNGDGATNSNWYSIFEYSVSTPVGQNSALLYYNTTAYASASYHQSKISLIQRSGRPWYMSDTSINANTVYFYSQSRGNLRDSASVTNVTTVQFVITNGSWSAGSDIRIYRGSK